MRQIKYRDFIYDIETFPNTFTFAAVYMNGKGRVAFEISDRKNQIEELLEFLRNVKRTQCRMVGFNNINFDYPVVHFILTKAKDAFKRNKPVRITAGQIYNEAMRLINKSPDDRFSSKIKDDNVIIPQVDLFLIHHFDNRARSTSLKMLEYNMRSDNIEDLPFPVGTELTHDQIDVLLKYNMHDVNETLKFYNYSKEALTLREELTVEFGFDCTNYNDGKIGKQLFITSLEKEKPGSCYVQTERGRKMNQTKRDIIHIKDCLVPYIEFQRIEFKTLYEWFKTKTITETKGVFSDIDEGEIGDLSKYSELVVKKKKFKNKPSESDITELLSEHPKGWVEEQDLKATEYSFDADGNHIMYQPLDEFGNATGKHKKLRVNKKSYWGCWKEMEGLNVVVDGVRYDYGQGGIHAAVKGIHKSNDEYIILTYDVASFYPNLSIKNNISPAHLGSTFCKVYSHLYDMRKSTPKGSAMNAALKLSLNSSYGDSGNEYSPLFDPQYTMSITCSGQMLLSMLIESIIVSTDSKVLMANTDGFEIMTNRKDVDIVKSKVADWEKLTSLTMEGDIYESMFIGNVNNYISVTDKGKVKLKGMYEHNDFTKHGWHKNHSSMVVAKAVEAYFINDVDYEEFIRLHRDKYDFLLRTKVPRSSSLVLVVEGEDVKQQNICRYYPSKSGGKLVKLMPPPEEDGDIRRLGIDTDYNIKTCNNIKDFDWKDLDYVYYINEAKKLIDGITV